MVPLSIIFFFSFEKCNDMIAHLQSCVVAIAEIGAGMIKDLGSYVHGNLKTATEQGSHATISRDLAQQLSH